MIKKFIIVILVFAFAVTFAQKNSISPYSVFNTGEKFIPRTVAQASMGGIGVALQEYNRLNFINPAGVANIRVATYTLAAQSTYLTVKNDNTSQSAGSTDLRYIALGFPLSKKSGFSLGLQPLSSVGYSLNNSQYDGETLEVLSRYKGSGGTNRLYGNFGIDVYKGLKIGVEGAFIFGSIENSIVQTKNDVALSTKYIENSKIRGGQFKLGMQYKAKVNEKLDVSTGVAVKFTEKLKRTGSEQMYSLSYNTSGIEIPKETLFDNELNSIINIPSSVVLGAGIGRKNKWYVALNTELQNAINDSNEKIDSFKNENYFRTSLGGFYIPRMNSISSYWDRITYRAGVRFENTGLAINTGSKNDFTTINDFGINVGLGLPLPKQVSNLNLGIEYGQRGTTNNNLIEESYFNVKLGLSLNSLNWFRKRKID